MVWLLWHLRLRFRDRLRQGLRGHTLPEVVRRCCTPCRLTRCITFSSISVDHFTCPVLLDDLCRPLERIQERLWQVPSTIRWWGRLGRWRRRRVRVHHVRVVLADLRDLIPVLVPVLLHPLLRICTAVDLELLLNPLFLPRIPHAVGHNLRRIWLLRWWWRVVELIVRVRKRRTKVRRNP